MTEYLVLLKLSPGKIIDAINALRKLPGNPSQGVDLCYTMNIFGTWDVGVWFNAENTAQASDFVHKKIKEISGVVDAYTVPTFPHEGKTQRISNNPQQPEKTETKTETTQEREESSAEETEKPATSQSLSQPLSPSTS